MRPAIWSDLILTTDQSIFPKNLVTASAISNDATAHPRFHVDISRIKRAAGMRVRILMGFRSLCTAAAQDKNMDLALRAAAFCISAFAAKVSFHFSSVTA